MSSLWQPRCPGSCSVGDSLGSGCGFVVLGSYFLYSFLCSSLGLVPCSYLCSLGLGVVHPSGRIRRVVLWHVLSLRAIVIPLGVWLLGGKGSEVSISSEYVSE